MLCWSILGEFGYYCVLLVYSKDLVVYLSQHGLHGEIYFKSHTENRLVIQTNFDLPVDFNTTSIEWSVRQHPINYNVPSGKERCDPINLGSEIMSLSTRLGKIQLPEQANHVWNLELPQQGNNSSSAASGSHCVT